MAVSNADVACRQRSAVQILRGELHALDGDDLDPFEQLTHRPARAAPDHLVCRGAHDTGEVGEGVGALGDTDGAADDVAGGRLSEAVHEHRLADAGGA
jgi:hypothetical protein